MGFNNREGAHNSKGNNEQVYEYVRGTNHLLDAMLGDEERVFIVNASHGRKPVSAETAVEALEKYKALYGRARNEAA